MLQIDGMNRGTGECDASQHRMSRIEIVDHAILKDHIVPLGATQVKIAKPAACEYDGSSLTISSVAGTEPTVFKGA